MANWLCHFRNFYFGICLGVMLCILSVGTVTANASGGNTELLFDLPSKTTEFISLRHMLKTFAKTQNIVLSDFIATNETRKTRNVNIEALREHAMILEKLTHVPEAGLSSGRLLRLPVISANPEKYLGVNLANLTELQIKLIALEKQIKRQECHQLEYVDPGTVDAERHNFLVYYATSVQGLCKTAESWIPSGIDRENSSLYGVFFKDHKPLAGNDLWPTLHGYLSVPDNQTYPIRAQIFLALYFHYLELAVDARYVTFGLNEFVVPSHKLKKILPDLVILQEQMNFGLARGFFQ